jgi:hypothetical protein
MDLQVIRHGLCSTVRDREVGGSNPLTPTNPKVKYRNRMRDDSGNPRMVEKSSLSAFVSLIRDENGRIPVRRNPV